MLLKVLISHSNQQEKTTEMDKNTKAIEELRKSLNESRKENKKTSLLEMIYNDEYEQDENSPGYESVPELAHEEAQEGEAYGENKPITKALPEENGSDPEIMEIFSNIRQAVISGLAKLANKPDTVSYDTMKKLLAIVDKPIEVANKEK